MQQLVLRFDTENIRNEFIYNDKMDDTVVDGTHMIDEIYFYENDRELVENIMKRLMELK